MVLQLRPIAKFTYNCKHVTELYNILNDYNCFDGLFEVKHFI